MKKILVLGAGMIGRAIAKDLAKDHIIKIMDISKENLSKLKNIENIKVIKSDARDIKLLKKYSDDCDLVISAVPGFLGFEILKKIIKCKKNVVDISFFVASLSEAGR